MNGTRAFALSLSLCLLFSAAPAQAATSAKGTSKGKSSDAPMDDLSFDLLSPSGAKPSKSSEEQERLEAEVKQRRMMLQVHQALGFGTWAGMTATTVLGQLEINDKYRGGGDTGVYQVPHFAAAMTTTGLFAAVGLLGVLAPTPYPKKFAWDTATFHKLFMGLATVGMVAQLALGGAAYWLEGTLGQRYAAQVHQAVGYATLGFLSAGAITLFF